MSQALQTFLQYRVKKPDRNESAGNRITEINFTLRNLDKFDGQIISAGIASETVQLIRFYSKFDLVISICNFHCNTRIYPFEQIAFLPDTILYEFSTPLLYTTASLCSILMEASKEIF